MYDVVIVGAGPVGLFLAGELALADCSVLVLEREQEQTSPHKALPLGLRGLNAGSTETFYRRGMLEELLKASGAEPARIGADPDAHEAPAPREVSHFAGMRLDPAGIDTAALPFRLPSPAMEGILTSLDAVETVLAERAARLGVRILRGVAVSAVTQDGDTVVARAGGSDHRARWLVGCDGGRSTVRELAGFGFVGTEPLSRPAQAGPRTDRHHVVRGRGPCPLIVSLPRGSPCPARSGATPARTARPPSGKGYLRFSTSSVSWGTTWKRSPTTPKSASSKIGASGSLLIAMMVLAVCMPARCWIAPEMPTAM
jgi:2-polyprenyl-6-methoxyphenol hydroxylase-like FAD-dependent oxidoreductase